MSKIPYAYLLRFPAVFGILFMLLPVLAVGKGAKSLLEGLFDLTGHLSSGRLSIFLTGLRMSLVAFFSLLFAWAVMDCVWLVVEYASQRFSVPKISHLGDKNQHAAVFGLLAAPTVFGAIFESRKRGGGTGAAFIALLVGAAVGILVAGALFAVISRWTGDLNNWRIVQAIIRFANPGPGYVTAAVPPRLQVGHIRALGLLFGTFVIYAAFGIAKGFDFGTPPFVPTLGCLLLLLTLLCWALSGLAFWLDRYLVPVFLPLLLLFLVTSRFPYSDRVYHVSLASKAAIPLPSPAEVISARNPDRVIVVAASGGGIQATAWTTTVLTELERASQKDSKGVDFAKSIRFISSVSGGSVGTMYFVDALPSDGLLADDDLGKIVDRAEASKLDDVAWGLIYPDLIGTVLPVFKYSDRGYGLEQAFARDCLSGSEHCVPPEHPLSNAMLSDWRVGIKEGWRPAVAFNSTITDNGKHFIFSTSGFPEEPDSPDKKKEPPRPSPIAARKLFYDTYRGYDVSVPTAVRMSATFPYVSPAARPDLDPPQFHLVDAAYSDNFGVSTLVDWLDEALRTSGVKHVLIIGIREADTTISDKPRSFWGTLSELLAPPQTLIRQRSAGQVASAEEQVCLIRHEAYPSETTTHVSSDKVALSERDIWSVVFTYAGEPPPLSWHLTETQKVAIGAAWKDPTVASQARIVKKFLEEDADSLEEDKTPGQLPVCPANKSVQASSAPNTKKP